MPKTNPRIRPTRFAVWVNRAAGAIDFRFEDVDQVQTVTMDGGDAFELASMTLTGLQYVPYPEAMEDMQQFALCGIEAAQGEGSIFLTYRFENGMGFRSCLPREQLVALHGQLGELLAPCGP